jgi:hypothetical protein
MHGGLHFLEVKRKTGFILAVAPSPPLHRIDVVVMQDLVLPKTI